MNKKATRGGFCLLDTRARKFVEPVIHLAAGFMIRRGIRADHITWASFTLGLAAGVSVLTGLPLTALTLLWTSGFLDALDGTVARRNGRSTPWGALMDITSDRLVELGLILALGIRYGQALLPLLMLTCSIVFSMTVFLTVGALTAKTGKKSFYYQAGLAERTEGFLLFSAMILLPRFLVPLTLLFAAAIVLTGLQRLTEARRLLKDKGNPPERSL